MTGTEPKGSSGKCEILLLDLDVGYTDGWVLDMFLSFIFRISAFFLKFALCQQKDWKHMKPGILLSLALALYFVLQRADMKPYVPAHFLYV